MAVSSEDGHKQALDTSSSLPRSSQEGAGPSGSASDYRGLNENGEDLSLDASAEKGLVFKIDLRLCTIAGILSSLNLIDSTLLSSASVTSLFDDLDLTGDRYSQAIWVYSVAYIAFQYPSAVLVRVMGPRWYFSTFTFAFGLITLGIGFISQWWQMYILRIFLGITTSGTFSGLQFVIASWYKRDEQQLRYAFLQSGEVIVLATAGIINYGLQLLDGYHGLAGWRYMFIVQGTLAAALGVVTYFWIPALPDQPASTSLHFLSPVELDLARSRIQSDRADLQATPWSSRELLVFALDLKVWGFAALFFCQNVVSTALSYFLPQILQDGMGFSSGASIILTQPPYYWSAIPTLITSLFSDRLRLRGPFLVFNCACLIAGLAMLGYASAPATRYAGTFLATGAYVSNWAALSAFTQNNIVGQWKRSFTAAVVTMFNGAGGVAGSYIFKQQEAPKYGTAIAVGIGSQALMCAIVAGFTAWFWWANRKVSSKGVLQGVAGWKYTY